MLKAECKLFMVKSYFFQRPWHEYESMYQIMFKVGMGQTPTIPDNIGDEGKDFISHCLVTDPETRWTASELRDHPFAKVKIHVVFNTLSLNGVF